MLTRKFSGPSIDETLKIIKKELGPDAIILKTVTNRGLKSAFNKNRIEITAAIPEKDYSNKLKVDSVLSSDIKDQFYKNNSQSISDAIKNYDHYNPTKGNENSGYGKLALNKTVQQVNTKEGAIAELDQFLSSDIPPISEKGAETLSKAIQNMIAMDDEKNAPNPDKNFSKDVVYDDRIDRLEKKMQSLQQEVDAYRQRTTSSINILVRELQAMSIHGKFIGHLIKKMNFELSEEELQNYDFLYDFTLREMSSTIHNEMPQFSSVQLDGKSSINIFYSELQSGQTSTILKLMSMLEKTAFITYVDEGNEGKDREKYSFSKDLFNIEGSVVHSLPELISECRKASKENKTIFIDCKLKEGSNQSVKRAIESLKMSFEFVESYLCLSSVHSELYNEKFVEKYKSSVDGLIFTFLDHCPQFSSIFNTHYSYNHIPLKFFTTGPTIPDDIESATSERLIAGLFKL